MEELVRAKEKLRSLSGQAKKSTSLQGCKERLLVLDAACQLPHVASELDTFQGEAVVSRLLSWFVSIELPQNYPAYFALVLSLLKTRA